MPGSQRFVDRHGKAIETAPLNRDVSWWSLRHEGNPILAIVHDSVLDEDQELLEAVGVAMTLALENRRLHHNLVDTVQALHGSTTALEKDLAIGVLDDLLGDSGATPRTKSQRPSELSALEQKPSLEAKLLVWRT